MGVSVAHVSLEKKKFTSALFLCVGSRHYARVHRLRQSKPLQCNPGKHVLQYVC